LFIYAGILNFGAISTRLVRSYFSTSTKVVFYYILPLRYWI